ncbi:MAG: chorismate mutase [Peptoniphilus sp.]|nr:chorismate mutase [Peptoniphilus sp.]MDY6045159.1 chorismate mutase [Peptoniphilus sp.]
MSIESMRREIDAIDNELIALLDRRFALSVAIGEEKKKEERSVEDGRREEEILARIRERSAGRGEEIAELYATLFELSRRLQR